MPFEDFPDSSGGVHPVFWLEDHTWGAAAVARTRPTEHETSRERGWRSAEARRVPSFSSTQRSRNHQ